MMRLAFVALFASVSAVLSLASSTGDSTAPAGPGPAPAAGPVAANRLLLPSIARDGLPSEVSLSTLSVYQGGALQVRVTRATSGTATVFGRVSTLIADGDGLVGFIGIGTEDPPYSADAVISYTTTDGAHERQDRWFTILKTKWTVDYITIPPPDPNAPPPPPGLVDEQPRLNAIYATVTPRRWTPGWVSPLTPAPGGVENCDTPGSVFPCVSGYFGEQRSFDGGPVQGHHGGTDLAARQATPIYATNDGTVVLAELVLERGNLVVIDHGGGVFSAYGHMSAFAVTNGQVVTKGQLIGYVG